MSADIPIEHSATAAADTKPRREVIYRHTFVVRLTHWINALVIVLLIGTGLNIFNAHPRLYWGQKGADFDRAFIEIHPVTRPNGVVRGETVIGPLHLDTTGVLGWSQSQGRWQARAWPSWLTIPSFTDLADARHWHFFLVWILVVNGLVYLVWSLLTRHLQRDLWPTVSDLRAIPRSVVEHVKLKHPTGEEAKRYNVLQRIAYLGLILLVTGMVATGLTMSPGFNAFAPWMIDFFGGRQSARTLHFLFASSIVLFIIVHLVEVVLAGPINEVRSIITGRFAVPPDKADAKAPLTRTADMTLLTRRAALLGGLGGAGLLTTGCEKLVMADKLTGSMGFQHVLAQAEEWTRVTQRFLQSGGAMAKEFTPADLSPRFKANGTMHPGGDAYARHVDTGFADWRLRIDGLVARPMSLSLDELRRLPARTQITRHDCVEGWSAIGQWTGAPLGLLLKAAGVAPGAKYAVFYCADNLEGEPGKGGEQAPGQYYESVAMVDAFHPQTLIAYGMNGRPLEIPHGAPLRLRVERQLGYKHAKYIQRIQIVDSLAGINGGKGGYWEDRGYEWYAGI